MKNFISKKQLKKVLRYTKQSLTGAVSPHRAVAAPKHMRTDAVDVAARSEPNAGLLEMKPRRQQLPMMVQIVEMHGLQKKQQ